MATDWLKDVLIRGEVPPGTTLTSIRPLNEGEVELGEWKESAKAGAKPYGVTDGTWPGITRGPAPAGQDQDTFVAAASNRPWVDANGYLVACLRAMAPTRPALLAPVPKKLAPYEGYELSLIESRYWGGNSVLTLEETFREALAKKEDKAVLAWQSLERTAAWLGQNAACFGRPVMPVITMAIEPEGESAEMANLVTRHGGSPALVRWDTPPPPDPLRRLVVVVAGMEAAPPPVAARRWLAHAEAGSSLVVDTHGEKPWWKVPGLKVLKEQEDRIFYTLGKGQVVGYREAIVDPSEFAFDVIDIVNYRRRSVRVWVASAAVALFTPPYVLLVNYGRQVREDFPVRVKGFFTKARLLRPEAGAADVPAVKRGDMTEIRVTALQRTAILALS